MKHEKAISAHIEPKDDLYYAIHKGLRLANAEMLIRLGRTDVEDDTELSATLAALGEHLKVCETHLEYEDTHVHGKLEARCPGGTDDASEDHAEHAATFTALRALMDTLLTDTANRPRLMRRLYQRFALFFAEDLVHMDEEENVVMPAIAAHFSPAEIKGIEQAIVASIPPAEMVESLRLMLRAASRSERVDMVRGFQAEIPGEIFDGVMSAVTGGQWRLGDWNSLERGLC